MVLPWSFKFAFGMINDCVPILGYRRKPYMVIGWSFCTLALLALVCKPLPEPYWCIGEDGKYITETTTEAGDTVAAEPCNADAANQGGSFALLMMLAALGYCIADVAADGLTVTIARQEPEATRGKTQTSVYLIRTCGNVVAVMIVGLCLNSYAYNGSFSWGLSFSSVMGIFMIPAAVMVPVSWRLVHEPTVQNRRSFKDYLGSLWELLRGRAMFFVILYQFLTPLIGNISTTAGGDVKSYWAEVKTFQNSIFSLVGLGLFAFGLWLVKTFFLGYSWRSMLLVTTRDQGLHGKAKTFFLVKIRRQKRKSK